MRLFAWDTIKRKARQVYLFIDGGREYNFSEGVMILSCNDLGFGSFYIGWNSLEPCQVDWSDEQIGNHLILHVYLAGKPLVKICTILYSHYPIPKVIVPTQILYCRLIEILICSWLLKIIHFLGTMLCCCSSFMPSTCSYHL